MTVQKGTYRLKTRDDGTITLTLKPRTPPVPPALPPNNVIDQLATNTAATYPFPDWDRPLTQIRHITVHHSAGSRDTTNVYYWHRLHTVTKSWSRVGYHFGIAKLTGPDDPIDLYQMNELSWHTWHDARNWDTVGVCMAGDLRAAYDGPPNNTQLDLFGRLMAWLVPQLPNLESIVGHKYWSATACPGDLHTYGQALIDATLTYGLDITPYLVWQPSLVRRALSRLTARGPEAE